MSTFKTFWDSTPKPIGVNTSTGTYVGWFKDVKPSWMEYTLTEQIECPGYLSLQGENTALAISEQGCLNFSGGYDVTIERMKFIGGVNHIKWTNDNINSARLTIRDCEFHGNSDFAIITTLPPGGTHLSTKIVIQNCRFFGGSVLKNCCDYATIEDCWVQPRDAWAKQSVFQNDYGNLFLKRMVGVPDLTRQDVFWVENKGNVFAQNSRFGGENGGIPCVKHTGMNPLTYPYMGSHISITDGQLSIGQDLHPKQCAIYVDGHLPKLIKIVNNNYIVGPYFKLGLNYIPTLNGQKIVIRDNMTHNSSVLPELLSYI